MLKKLFGILLVVAMIFAMLVSTAFAAAEAKTAKALEGTPAIDAEVDAAWKDAPALEGFNQSGQKIMGETTDIEPTVKMLWDKKALYVLFQVKDSTVGGIAVKEDDLANNDGIEVYLDQDNAKKLLYGDDDLWIKVDYQGNFANEKNAPDTKYKAKKTSDGYIIEVSIPWTKIEPKAGDTVGFDVSISDNKTGTNARSTWIGWNDSTNNAWQSPKVFGNLELAAAGKAVSGSDTPKETEAKATETKATEAAASAETSAPQETTAATAAETTAVETTAAPTEAVTEGTTAAVTEAATEPASEATSAASAETASNNVGSAQSMTWIYIAAAVIVVLILFAAFRKKIFPVKR